MKSADYWIEQLNLIPHVEGGYYQQMLKSDLEYTTADKTPRALYTSIYFLLTAANPSHFHRLTADEVWYFHEGASLTIHLVSPEGNYDTIKLGHNPDAGEVLQAVVPRGFIFGSTVAEDYALVSCMVAPGFEYHDFELFTRQELLATYPEHQAIIQRLTRK